MVYTETYRDLCHGTDEISAQKIKDNGFEIRNSPGLWCGAGVYFYDIKAKAWWYANNICHNIKKETGITVKPAVIFADIVDIPKTEIFDLRVAKDVEEFQNFVTNLIEGKKLTIAECTDEEETILLRSMLISFYAKQMAKKLVIGIFQQREQPQYTDIIEFTSGLKIVFGVETIYCVRDISIIENIR